MPRSCTIKLVVISNTSVSVTDSKEDVNELPLAHNLETAKYITWNVKFNNSNKEVLALFDFGSKTNLISQAYVSQLPFKIMDIV